jgi:ATP synthase subunit 10
MAVSLRMLLRWRHGMWVTAICFGVVPGRAQTAERIPAARGTTLAGDAVALPDAFKGDAGVLVVGFSKASQGAVAAWGRRLAKDYRESQKVPYFEVAMLEGAPRLLRGMIVHEMRSSVPEAERAHFLTLTDGETAWRAAAHYAKPDDAYVLLVDGSGAVRWQMEGDATDAAYAALKRGLEAVSGPGGSR